MPVEPQYELVGLFYTYAFGIAYIDWAKFA
jgi:hypothetical protein